MTPIAQTLTQQLAAGRLPLADALRYAVQIVDALRHAHEDGCSHGALTPDAVILTPNGVELIPPPKEAAVAPTRYMAPERLQGQPADVRSDIFSLGAVLYEMFTGHPAFAGESAEEWQDAILHATPVPVGDTGIDRLVLNCLVKDPSGRWQRVQQVYMELKILTFSSRRAQVAALPRRPEAASLAEVRQVEAGLQHLSSQIPLIEAQLAGRLEEQYGEATAAVRHIAAELPLIEAHLSSRLEQRCGELASDVRRVAAELPRLDARLSGRLDQQDAAVAGLRQTAASLPERIERYETALAALEQAGAEYPARMDQQEAGLSALRQALNEVPQMTSRLGGRLDQHESALADLRQVAAAIPELQQARGEIARTAAGLDARLGEHESALADLRQVTAAIPERMDLHAAALEELQKAAGTVPPLSSRLDRHRTSLDTLERVTAEQTSVLELVTHTLNLVQEQVSGVESRLGEVKEQAEQATAAAAAEKIENIEITLQSQASAIASIRAAMARTDDFMERVVEALESLQTMVLEQARDRAA